MPPRISRGDGRRGGGDPDQLVGGEPDSRDVRAVMRVEIDEARRDELTARVDPLEGSIRRDAGSDRGDLAVLDAHVPLPSELLTRIQHVPAGDDEVELEGRVRGVEATRLGAHVLERRLRRLR